MNKTKVLNTIVILGALSAILAAIHATTTNKSGKEERERCYGVVRAGQNDCANGKHSCVNKSTTSGNSAEWIMLPKGTCEKIVGGNLSEVKKPE
jgi:uncharacterized membrane protein